METITNNEAVDISTNNIFEKQKEKDIFYEKLSLLQESITEKSFCKDSKNEYQKNKYLSLDGILKTLMPLVNEAGFVFQFHSLEEKKRNTLVGGNEIKELYTLKATLTYINGQSQNYWLDIPPPESSKGANATQRMGMVATYAKRYLISMVFCIATDEDTDGVIATNKAVIKKEQWILKEEAMQVKKAIADYKKNNGPNNLLQEINNYRDAKDIVGVRKTKKLMDDFVQKTAAYEGNPFEKTAAYEDNPFEKS